MGARTIAAVAALHLATFGLAGIASAAEIKIMVPAPMRTSMVELLTTFESTHPHKVVIVHAPSKMIVERIEAGEPLDVAILTNHATDALIRQNKLSRRVDLVRSSLGVAVRSGAPKPDVSSVDAFKRTLLAAKSFARNAGAESGIHMESVFERLGIAEQMKAKTTAMPVGTGYVASLVARGEVEMAAQQMPELMAVPGVDPTPLPAELQLVIVFSAGIAVSSKQPDAVKELVAFLTSPAAASVFKLKGLDPAW